jgi:2-polyprenyl-3-methyl-5-hydroxy-6-metoxy-1,4-benzoquinol methylase
MTDSTETRYGWTSEAPTCANDYLEAPVLGLVNRLTPRGGVVVDLGCGNGYLAGRLARLGYDVTGTDAAIDGIEQARRAHPAARFVLGSVYDDLELPRADTVISCEVIEHLYHPRKLLTLAHNVLKPGGALILSTPYHGYLKNLALSLTGKWDRHFTSSSDGAHIKFFSPSTLAPLVVDAGFCVDDIRGVGRLPYLWKSMIVVARSTP